MGLKNGSEKALIDEEKQKVREKINAIIGKVAKCEASPEEINEAEALAAQWGLVGLGIKLKEVTKGKNLSRKRSTSSASYAN